MPFDAQMVIVQPLRRQGEYASDGRFLFSHLNTIPGGFEVEGFDFAKDFEVLEGPTLDDGVVGVEGIASVGRVIL